MKYYIFLIISIVVIFSNCNKDNGPACPFYDFTLGGGHNLKVPIAIIPNKMQYRIGDTINISTNFSDSIRDISVNHTFKIEGFPFKPVPLLYRFDDELNKSSGFRENELIVDEKYNHVYNFSENYADGFRAYTIYDSDEDRYHFEFDLVLETKGTYIMIMSDLYESYIGSGNFDKNAEANAITFEGKCDAADYSIRSIVEGENYIFSFLDEIIHLDTLVYRGEFQSITDVNKPPGERIFGSGSLVLEWNGAFCFRVVE